jgi:hypothetical protein
MGGASSSLAVAAVVAAMGSVRLPAQQASTSYVQPEVRSDLIVAHTAAIELAGGAVFPVGEYLRLGGDLGGGVAGGPEHSIRATGRADAYGRFHLDPFDQSRWALYLVGGGSYRFTAGARSQLYLLVGIGAEGPPTGGVVPAIEAGFGGGFRIGFALRRALKTRR